MVKKVIWTSQARRQLREITDYLCREAGTGAATKIRGKIAARPKILAANPHAGQREELLADIPVGFRYLVEGNYKIVYYATDEKVFVVTIFDCRRDPSRLQGEVPEY